MGKKSKTEKKLLSVSVVTINQIKRQDTIKLTAEYINNQTYKNIVEWVIVEGSKNLEECIVNEQNVKELVCKVPIVYVSAYKMDDSGNKTFNGNHLGELRNLSNKNSIGEIIVCMDDDDWYPKTRVEHCVDMLSKSKAGIAGCSGKYLYDYCLEHLYKFKDFGPNHSTNDCFAYKRSYLEDNSYDPSKDMAEEASFTKQFSNPMVQLEAKHTIIGSSHSQNTFNKKEICITGSLWVNPTKPEDGFMYPMTLHPSEKVTDIMGQASVDKYTSIFNKSVTSEFDIVYFCGGTSIDWDPNSKSLGGSEQAVVHISKEWAIQGKKVAVYGKLTQECILDRVHFIDWKKFPFHKQHNIVILWRMSGINCGLPFPIRANKLWVDFHDNNFQFRHAYLPYEHKIDKIFFW